ALPGSCEYLFAAGTGALGARLVPEQAARGGYLLQDLVPGQRTDNVAAVGARELTRAVDRERLVITISATRPLGEAATTELPVLDRLCPRGIQHRQVEAKGLPARLVAAIEEHPGPLVLFQKSFVTGRHVAVGRQAEAVLGDATEVVGQGAQAG